MQAIRLLPARNTRALLAIDGPAAATFNTIVEATDPDLGGNGNLITLALASGGLWVPNIGTLTLAANPGDTETCTIGANVYTFQTVLTDVAGNVLIGASASATLDNLIACVNAAAGAGTTYAAASVVHPQVRAFAGAGDTMVVHTKPTVLTAVGTLIATTDGMVDAGNVWGAATLADGTDGTNVAFSVVGNAVSCVFSSGYTTVSDFEAALNASATARLLLQVKTAGTTPLYCLVVTDDDFTATALTGGGAASATAPTDLTDKTLGYEIPFCDQALVTIRSVAGADAMTASPILWGFIEELGYWFVLGALNAGVAIAETSTDGINYAERIIGLRGVSALWVQLASAGTAPEFEMWAVPARATAGTR